MAKRKTTPKKKKVKKVKLGKCAACKQPSKYTVCLSCRCPVCGRCRTLCECGFKQALSDDFVTAGKAGQMWYVQKPVEPAEKVIDTGRRIRLHGRPAIEKR